MASLEAEQDKMLKETLDVAGAMSAVAAGFQIADGCAADSEGHDAAGSPAREVDTAGGDAEDTAEQDAEEDDARS